MQPILEEVDKIINGERQDTYGSPEDSFKLIADYWDAYLWAKCRNAIDGEATIDAKDVAAMMTLFKIARMSGQQYSRDNPRDAIGYLAILADRLNQPKEPKE